MAKITITLALSGIFIGYIFYSMSSLYLLYNPKQCNNQQEICMKPSWNANTRFQFFFCTSRFSKVRHATDLKVIWKDDSFNALITNEKEINVTLPPETLNNGTLYAYALFYPRAGPPKDLVHILDDPLTSYGSGLLTRYLVPEMEIVSLIESESYTERKPVSEVPVTHWKPNIEVNIMSQPFQFFAKKIPGEIAYMLRFNSKREYLPVVYISEVTSRIKDFVPINASIPKMAVKVAITPVTVGRLRLLVTVSEALKSMHAFGLTEKDTDEVKGIFFDTNIYLLLLTLLVSSFHLLFDFLAFKNDINFWKGKKTLVGLSFRGVMWRGLSQVIIFLYLMDEDTSRIVLLTNAVGTLIELWKVSKALKLQISFDKWRIKVRFGSNTEEEKKTDEYDSQGMKYLSYILYPLCIGGAIYSLLYQSYRSWYSWLIHSLANGVYAFGFLFMLPQLFLNYKYKSVAHLPWRVFMYKAFNTFIDDLFAFIITMPTAHRVACFRDDAVFLVYLYQKWLYPVDKTRANEFGESFEDSAELKNGKSKSE